MYIDKHTTVCSSNIFWCLESNQTTGAVCSCWLLTSWWSPISSADFMMIDRIFKNSLSRAHILSTGRPNKSSQQDGCWSPVNRTEPAFATLMGNNEVRYVHAPPDSQNMCFTSTRGKEPRGMHVCEALLCHHGATCYDFQALDNSALDPIGN